MYRLNGNKPSEIKPEGFLYVSRNPPDTLGAIHESPTPSF